MSDFTQSIELPIGWVICTLSDASEGDNAIVDGPFGSNLKTSDYVDDTINGVPVLTTKNLEGDYSDKTVRFISKAKFQEIKRSQVNPGDILVAKIGSIGKTGIYPKNGRTAIIPANLLKFTVSKEIAFDYVYSYLTFFGLQNKIKAIATATAQPAFNVTKFRLLEIPLPPVPEQHRIVAKIEELFSSLDKGIESLKTAQQQLKVYRQAVLKWAFEGKLTNKNVVDKELPEGWKWVKLGEVCTNVEYGSAAKSKEVGKVPVLRMGNIQGGKFDWDDLVYTDDEIEINKYLLKKNDVLFNRTNSPEWVGKTAMYKGERPAIFAGYLIRINRIETLIDASYLTYYLNSHIAREYGNSVRTFGVNQANINGTKLKTYPLPLPLLSEQHAIVAEIESRLSVCDKIEESIEDSLKQSEALRQSILKKAFEGRLVPQDPNDEPASILLERIKAERERNKAEAAQPRQARRTKRARGRIES